MNDQDTKPDQEVAGACAHMRRERQNQSGFASAETVCVDCGQSFDPEQEAALRSNGWRNTVSAGSTRASIGLIGVPPLARTVPL